MCFSKKTIEEQTCHTLDTYIMCLSHSSFFFLIQQKYMVFISVSEIDFSIHSPLNLRGNEQWQNHKDEHY